MRDQLYFLFGVIDFQSVCISALATAIAERADSLILVDESSRPIFLGEGAAALLQGSNGLAFIDGVIRAERGPERRKLATLIRRTSLGETGREGGTILVAGRASIGPHMLRVLRAPAPSASPAIRYCTLLIYSLGDMRSPSTRILREAFGLTRREAELAAELVRLPHLQAAASRAGMAVNTARNHLSSIFLKSGTTSQAEAVQLFSRMPADRAAHEKAPPAGMGPEGLPQNTRSVWGGRVAPISGPWRDRRRERR